MRNVDVLSFIVIDIYVPGLIPRLNSTETSLQLSEYCDVLPGNESVICGFWILYSVYRINRQAEFNS
jgi:hypothetical protein